VARIRFAVSAALLLPLSNVSFVHKEPLRKRDAGWRRST
jgi:hypothetical protein